MFQFETIPRRRGAATGSRRVSALLTGVVTAGLIGGVFHRRPLTADTGTLAIRVTEDGDAPVACRIHLTRGGEVVAPQGHPFFRDHFAIDLARGWVAREMPRNRAR